MRSMRLPTSAFALVLIKIQAVGPVAHNRRRELTRGNKSGPEKGINMTREAISAIFPEATEEQVTAFLNANNTEVNDYKSKYDALKKGPTAEQLQAEKDKSAQLETELSALKNANAVRLVREKVAGEKKIPANLLTADTEEACNAQADAILAFAQPDGYPVVKDNGGPDGPAGAPSTEQLFANWAEAQLK